VIEPNLSTFLNRDPHFQHKKFDIGDFTYGGPKVISWGGGYESNLKIGRFCSIADEVEIYLGGEHLFNNVTSYPFSAIFNSGALSCQRTKGDIVIGNDVWIGRRVTILSGVTIGDGAVVGAGAVVAKDIPPYAVAVGNPVRCIKFRFTEDQIESLLKIKWWDWDYKKISEYIPLLENGDIDKFIKRAESD